MKYQLPDGRIVEPNQPFTYNDLQYPANWTQLASLEELAALGMVEYIDPPLPPVAPEVVSMRQARLALLADGKLQTVKDAVAAMSEAAQIEWEYATEVRRDNALTQAIASVLSLTSAEIDALFIQAEAM